MKINTKYIIIIIFIISIISFDFNTNAIPNDIKLLKTLDFQDSRVKALRNDIRKSIIIIKSNKNPNLLPKLKFYKYKVKRNENFWEILTRTSQNIDTLASINSLASPKEIYPGKMIYIPNYRGIIYKDENTTQINTISKKFAVDAKYIYKLNKKNKKPGSYLFIPCAKFSNTERSLFLGVGFQFPLKKGRRTSKFGLRRDPFYKRIKFHNGIDLATPIGSKVFAARSGKVFFTGYKGGYGLLVILKHSHDYYSYYGHLSKIFTKKGDELKRGDIIALSGNTGRTTGPHLHFEVRKRKKPINPGILIR
ncbi:MAG: LysM peptidoglycan-binding domain-containing M23 family metallopeptidase [Spirochaetota bacterium]|nr:LysM peptidoglycan-binding domain-containing M23 family metallopeptidase [Spirochaetota bacterium]